MSEEKMKKICSETVVCMILVDKKKDGDDGGVKKKKNLLKDWIIIILGHPITPCLLFQSLPHHCLEALKLRLPSIHGHFLHH